MAATGKTYLLILVFIQAVHVISCCRYWTVRNCVAALISYGGDDGGLSYSLTTAELRHVCSLFQTAEECVYRADYQDCHELLMLQWDSLDGTFSYLCHEGFDDYITHSYCLSSRQVNQSIHQCNMEQHRSVDEWHYNGSPKHGFCNIMDNSIECVRRAVSMYCDDDARDHMTTMMVKGFQPLKDYLDCSDYTTTIKWPWPAATSFPPWSQRFTGNLQTTTEPSAWSFHHTKAWAIGVAIAVTILGLAVVGLITFVACWLKKYRNNRASTPPSTGNIIGNARYPVLHQGYPQITFSSPGNASKDAMVHFDVNNPAFQNAGNHYRQQNGHDDMQPPQELRDAWSPPPPYVQPLSAIAGAPMLPATAPADTAEERPSLDQRREAWSPPPPYIQNNESSRVNGDTTE